MNIISQSYKPSPKIHHIVASSIFVSELVSFPHTLKLLETASGFAPSRQTATFRPFRPTQASSENNIESSLSSSVATSLSHCPRVDLKEKVIHRTGRPQVIERP